MNISQILVITNNSKIWSILSPVCPISPELMVLCSNHLFPSEITCLKPEINHLNTDINLRYLEIGYAHRRGRSYFSLSLLNFHAIKLSIEANKPKIFAKDAIRCTNTVQKSMKLCNFKKYWDN